MASALSTAELKRAWIAAGGNPTKATMAAAIAHAESGAIPTAVCHNCVPGVLEHSVGLWQININPNANPEFAKWNLFNPVTNALAAVKLSKNGTNWGDWTTYTSGAYKKFLQPNVGPAPASASTGPLHFLGDYTHGANLNHPPAWLTKVEQLELLHTIRLPKGAKIVAVKWPNALGTQPGGVRISYPGAKNPSERHFWQAFTQVSKSGVTIPNKANAPWDLLLKGKHLTLAQYLKQVDLFQQGTPGQAKKAAKTLTQPAGHPGPLPAWVTALEAYGQRAGLALLAFALVAIGLLLLATGSKTKALARAIQPRASAPGGQQSAAAAAAA
jgi:hypothetical protein